MPRRPCFSPLPVLVVAAFLVVAGTAQAQHPGQMPAGNGTVAYDVTLTGVGNDDLRADLEGTSLLFDLRDEPPRTVLGLRRRANQDADRLRKVLESEGYYAAAIRHTVDTAATPAQVTLEVEAGPRYTLDTLTVDYADPKPGRTDGLPRGLEDLKPEDPRADWAAVPGAPARADTVLDAVDRVARLLRERGYPDAKVTGHKATVNHADHSMAVTVTVAAGGRATFGETTISGTERVETDYLRRHQPWRAGEDYDIAAVEAFRRSLLATGLFQSAIVEPAGEIGADGRLPMKVTVIEADQRSIGAGARYSTSLGPTLSAFWEHRNMFGQGEDVRIESEVSPVLQSLGADLAKPHFLRWDQTLNLSSKVSSEEFEAYDRDAVEAFVGLDRRIDDSLTVGAGVSLDYAEIAGHDEQEEDHRSRLVGFPVTLGLDNTDNLLDPRGGARLSLSATPYTGHYDGPVTFGKVRGELSAYLDLGDDGDTVLAGRVAAGTIVGAARTGVPPDKRFYAGGGGSIRGYGYQMAGALDDEDDPIGGNSLIEGSLELRQKMTDTIGVVPFFDVGRAYEEATPHLGDKLFMAAGLGARYYSAIGPVRLDIAVPLDRRDGADDTFQFYVSLGQAF